MAATRQPKDQLGRGPPPAATRAGCAVGWEKHACPEGRALQLSRAWRCLQLAHVWAGKDSVCSEPWLPERVELSAETPPAPRSAGAAGSSAGAPGGGGSALPGAEQGGGHLARRSTTCHSLVLPRSGWDLGTAAPSFSLHRRWFNLLKAFDGAHGVLSSALPVI